MEILIILDFSFIVSKNRLDFSWNRKKKKSEERERRRNVWLFMSMQHGRMCEQGPGGWRAGVEQRGAGGEGWERGRGGGRGAQATQE